MSSLVGRAQEQAALLAALESAASGRGSLVLLGGEAGAGKSALVREFTDRASRGAEVLIGWCDPLSTPRPGGPLVDMATRLGPEFRELFADGRRTGLLDAVLTALTSDEAVRVVVFEDVHWADELTLDLLTFLARRVPATHLVVVVTFRSDELDPAHPAGFFLGEAGRSDAVLRLDLGPLTETDLRDLVGASGVDPRELFARTAGNAFFATEVLAAGGEVPAKVADAVLARASRLSGPARRALAAAAVVGARVEPTLLLGLDGVTATAVDECVSRGLLRFAATAFEFRHELARQAVLEATPPAERSALHARALALLRTDPAPDLLARLAEHAELAGDTAAISEFAPRAADRASALGAHREAARQYQRALSGDIATADRRSELLAALSYELYLTGRLDEAVPAREESLAHHEAAGNALAAGEDLRWLSRIHWYAGRRALAEECAVRAVKILEPLGPTASLGMAWSTRSQLALLGAQFSEAVELGNRALAIADRSGDLETRVHALNNIGTSLLESGDLAGADVLDQSLRLALENGYDDHAARAYVNAVFSATRMRDFAMLDRYLGPALAHVANHQVDLQRTYLEASRLLSDVHRGRWEGVPDDVAALQQQLGSSVIHRFVALLPLLLVAIRTGAPSAELLAEAEQLAATLAEPQRTIPVLLARAESAWLRGELDGLAETLATAAATAGTTAKQHAAEIAWWCHRIDPAAATGSGTGVFSAVLEQDVPRAAATWLQLGCPYEAGITLLDGGEGDLREALAIFTRLGAAPAAAIARKRLAALGVRGPRAATVSNEYGLTAREQQVLELLRERRTNAEIAAELVLSERTVHHHVSAVLGKLGVSSRTEAAARSGQPRSTT